MRDAIADHYSNEAIADRLLAAVRATLPPGAPITVEALSAADHLHGRGLAATKELAELLAPRQADHVLDIGSGVGGPARWIAHAHGCRVTGIDLTPAFCRAAIALNAAIGMTERVAIVEGSALAMPFADATFDCAYSHNVVMNIADKRAFYREAARVLKPGGRLVLMNLIWSGAGTMKYPTPWASTAATSFLATLDETRADLLAANLEIVRLEDTTERFRNARRAYAKQLEQGTAAPLGPHLIMGSRMAEFQVNSVHNEESGAQRSMESVVRKPA